MPCYGQPPALAPGHRHPVPPCPGSPWPLWYHGVQGVFVLLVLALLSPGDSSSQMLERCPDACKCLDKGSIVTCRHGKLTQVPPVLSTALFLDLDDNRLARLVNASFSPGLGLLEILSLEANSIATVEEGAFDDLPSLRILRLGRNRLSSLPPDVFAGNSLLELLDLHGNQFTEVPDTIMYPLHGLQLLNMSFNQITSPYLGPGFKHTPKLHSIDLTGNSFHSLESNVFQSTLWWDQGVRHALNLSYCDIKHIHPYAFGKLYRLQILSLAGNPNLSDDDLHTALSDLEVSTLTSLNLSWMNLTEVYDVFQRFQHRNLLQLFLAHNNIQTIKQGTFFYLENLQNLDLSFNALMDIGDLNSLSKLEYLNLAYNTIDRIDVTTFEGLHNLKVLDLSHNSLGEISDGPFQTLFYLRYLDVSCNLINRVSISSGLEHLEEFRIASNHLLSVDFTSHLPRLHTLDASDNSLTSLGPHVFLQGQVMSLVNFSSNVINTIDRLAFSGSSQYIVDLSYNEIRQLDKPGWFQVHKLYLQGNSMINISAGCLEGLSSLEELSLANNQLQTFPKTLCSDLSSVRKLDLSHNPLQASIHNELSQLAELEILHLSDINLHHVPPHFFTNFTRLRVLDLSLNPLHTIHPDGLASLTGLRVLNLSGNSLSTPDPAAFTALPALHTIDLTNNPFSCTCHLMPFRYWVLASNISHGTQVYHSRRYHCHSPPEWAGISLRDFYVEGSSCSPHEKAVIFTAVGCTIVAVMLTVVVAIYKFKCWQVGKFDSARYSAIDDRLDRLDQQQEQRLMARDISSSPTTSTDVHNHSSSQPWL